MAVSVESFLAGSARSKAQFIGERTIAACAQGRVSIRSSDERRRSDQRPECEQEA